MKRKLEDQRFDRHCEGGGAASSLTEAEGIQLSNPSHHPSLS